VKIDYAAYATFAVMDAVWKQTPPRTDISEFMDWDAAQSLDGAPFNDAMNEITKLVAEAQRASAIYHRDMAKMEKIYEQEQAEEAATAAPASAPLLLGSTKHPGQIDIGGEQVELGEIAAFAFEQSGATVDEWNALPQADRDVLIDAVIDEARSDAKADAAPQQPAETVNG